MEEICNRKTFQFKLRNHQLFLRNYISPHTPYNGILIFMEQV